MYFSTLGATEASDFTPHSGPIVDYLAPVLDAAVTAQAEVEAEMQRLQHRLLPQAGMNDTVSEVLLKLLDLAEPFEPKEPWIPNALRQVVRALRPPTQPVGASQQGHRPAKRTAGAGAGDRAREQARGRVRARGRARA